MTNEHIMEMQTVNTICLNEAEILTKHSSGYGLNSRRLVKIFDYNYYLEIDIINSLLNERECDLRKSES